MVKKRLVKFIKKHKSQGHSLKDIHDHLVKHGHDINEVSKCIDIVSKDKRKLMAGSYLAFSFIILVIVIFFAYTFITRPECGNMIVDEGETSETCCMDAGCIGEQVCRNNVCKEPTCKECQYLEDHLCKNYACCSDLDCSDNDPKTAERCENPSELTARCFYTQRIEIKKGVTEVSVGRNRLVEFELEDEPHAIYAENIDKTSATIIISSEPIKITLVVGRTKAVDIDKDGLDDISITLLSITNGNANLLVKRAFYECVTHSDCDDNDPNTIDRCFFPKTSQATCSNTEKDECIKDSDCDDNRRSTKDTCSGIPRECSNERITECDDGDGYCPRGCENDEDDDCDKEAIDCGGYSVSLINGELSVEDEEDFDCFIEASEECDPAELSSSGIVDFLGLIIRSEAYMELRGIESDKCIYYQKTIKSSIEYTDDAIQQLLDNGLTQEEIDDLEQEADDAAQELVGMERICRFETDDLMDMLERWKDGDSDSGTTSCTWDNEGNSNCTTEGGDFGDADCDEFKKES